MNILGHGINVMDIVGFVHDASQPTTHFNALKKSGFGQTVADFILAK